MNSTKQLNNNLVNLVQIIELFDIYKELLTEKQQEYFVSYYFNDMSLAEISSIHNISRNAILDSLKKTISILENYESKLGLLKLKNKVLHILKQSDNIEYVKNEIKKIDFFNKE